MQRFEELMRQAEENQRLANREAERLKQRQEEDERRKREQSRRDRDERQQLEVKSRLAAVKAKQMERNMLRDMAASKRAAEEERAAATAAAAAAAAKERRASPVGSARPSSAIGRQPSRPDPSTQLQPKTSSNKLRSYSDLIQVAKTQDRPTSSSVNALPRIPKRSDGRDSPALPPRERPDTSVAATATATTRPTPPTARRPAERPADNHAKTNGVRPPSSSLSAPSRLSSSGSTRFSQPTNGNARTAPPRPDSASASRVNGKPTSTNGRPSSHSTTAARPASSSAELRKRPAESAGRPLTALQRSSLHNDRPSSASSLQRTASAPSMRRPASTSSQQQQQQPQQMRGRASDPIRRPLPPTNGSRPAPSASRPASQPSRPSSQQSRHPQQSAPAQQQQRKRMSASESPASRTRLRSPPDSPPMDRDGKRRRIDPVSCDDPDYIMQNTSSIIQGLFGRPHLRRRMYDSDEDEDMEASFVDTYKEEQRSARLARIEDEKAEAEEKRRREMRKKMAKS